MWNMMKCFIYEVQRVAIDKLCWKSKMKDWDYISSIKIWDHMQICYNIKYMANNKREKYHGKFLQLHVIFKYTSEFKECTL